MPKKIAIALHAWQGDGGGKRCLTFRAGDRIRVIEAREAGGWWAGSLDGRQGWFPSSFCRIEDEPEEDLLDLSGSSTQPSPQRAKQPSSNLIGEPIAAEEAKPAAAAASFFSHSSSFGKRSGKPGAPPPRLPHRL